jgi:hypothetical protein
MPLGLTYGTGNDIKGIKKLNSGGIEGYQV